MLVHVSPSSITPPASQYWELTSSQHKISRCSITLVKPMKPRDTAVLQVTCLYDRLSSIYNSLSKTTTLSEHFGFHLLHSLPNRAVSNIARRDVQEPQQPTADVRKEYRSSSWKRKDLPGMQREKGQMCGAAKCQIYSLTPWGLQIECNWHSCLELLLWNKRVLLCIDLIRGIYKR